MMEKTRNCRHILLQQRPKKTSKSNSGIKISENNGNFFLMLLCLILTCLICSSTLWAGQIVTDDVRSWAKTALEKEKGLKTIATPNTVAIMYFHNKTDLAKLDLLQKGIAIMLISDLSKLDNIQLVERVKIQALVEEMGFGVSGLVDSKTNPRIGRLLGAEHIVGGDIIKEKIKAFQLKANVLKVPAKTILSSPAAEGELLDELFKMEKELLFDMVKLLNIHLTDEQEKQLKKPISNNLNALLYLFMAIEQSDLGNYKKAYDYYQQALEEDPDLELADQLIQELKERGIWLVEWDEAGEAEAYSGKPSVSLPRKSERDGEKDKTPVENNCEDGNCADDDQNCEDGNCDDDTGEGSVTVDWDIIEDEEDPVLIDDDDEDFDNDNDGYTIGQGDCDDLNSSIHPGATEICGDGIDQDCVGGDEACPIPDVDISGYDAEGMIVDIGHIVKDIGSLLGRMPASENEIQKILDGDYISKGFNDLYGSWTGIGDDTEYTFWQGSGSGSYPYGYQTVGRNQTPLATTDGYSYDPANFMTGEIETMLVGDNAVGLLAYAVQVEEDHVNKKILEMYDVQNALSSMRTASGYQGIRDRDAFFVQQADAQSGRVLRDINGNWVRVQQYILRPEDNLSVQLLNVCLRGSSSLSTMNWTTTFTGAGYSGNLRLLPWSEWLNTDSTSEKRIYTTFDAPVLQSMSVIFTNPAQEFLSEIRTFSGRIENYQLISLENLTISTIGDAPFTFSADSPNKGEYTIESYSPGGFTYKFNDGLSTDSVNVGFYIVGDINPDGGGTATHFKDIWDALRVNESGAPNIGNNNLEIVLSASDQTILSQPIDIVYIPMSRMLWRE